LAERPKGFLGRLLGGRGKIQGTRSYISPEQIRRQTLDQRSDIYSFACTLQELITGRPPFTGSTDTELLNKHLKAGPPPLDGYGRGIKPEFNQLMRRMLAKNPSERPDSMDEVVDVIRSSRVFRTPPPPPKASASTKEQSTEETQ
jgi:serine/threonine protein kinase